MNRFRKMNFSGIESSFWLHVDGVFFFILGEFFHINLMGNIIPQISVGIRTDDLIYDLAV